MPMKVSLTKPEQDFLVAALFMAVRAVDWKTRDGACRVAASIAAKLDAVDAIDRVGGELTSRLKNITASN